MNSIPYVDIHTHPHYKDDDTITVRNMYPGDKIPPFNGRNFYSVGIHPWDIGKKSENNSRLQMVKAAMELEHVIFVGEAGLDKIVNNSFKEQKRMFELHANLSELYSRPLIIHCVRAYNELMEYKMALKPTMPWIIHGYQGSVEMTKQMEKKGFLFSFGRNLYRNSPKLIETFKYLPLDKIFIETDESETNVQEFYKIGALLKEIPVEQLKQAVWVNFNRIENNKNGEQE